MSKKSYHIVCSRFQWKLDSFFYETTIRVSSLEDLLVVYEAIRRRLFGLRSRKQFWMWDPKAQTSFQLYVERNGRLVPAVKSEDDWLEACGAMGQIDGRS